MLSKIDVYTVLLGVALLAVLMAVLLLALELGRFGAPIPSVAHVDAQPRAVVASVESLACSVVHVPA